MSIKFQPAVRTNVPLLIGLAGGTGSGKTYTAMRMAVGLSGGKRFAVIDTENGRARHYADQFEFDVADLRAPFTPQSYLEAIKAADAAEYPVIMVDSASHEHAGDGGLLDMHEAELDRMAGQDWKKRDSCNMAAWIKPKGAHKEMMNVLLQVKAHVVLCFRAEEKIEMVKDPETRKMVIRPKQSTKGKNGWLPISEKNLPFELTCSFLFMDDAPGVPIPIKLQEQHKAFFPLDKPVTEAAGAAMAQWAKGGKASAPEQSIVAHKSTAVGSTLSGELSSLVPSVMLGSSDEGVRSGTNAITPDQAIALDDALSAASIRSGNLNVKAEFMAAAKIGRLSDLQASKYARAMTMIEGIGA